MATFQVTRDVHGDAGAQILDALSHTPRFNRWMASVLAPHLGDTVLEIGAGIGNLSLWLSEGKSEYWATDCDADYLARLRARLERRPNIVIRRCDAEDADDFRALGRVFASAICANVLEHVDDDLGALRNIHSVLQPGGTAVVLVPHDPAIYGSFDRVLEHRRRYTKVELQERMERAGFEVQCVLEFNRVTRPGWILNACILKRESFGRLQLWIFDRFVWLWRRIDAWLPWGPISIVAVGVKR
jgi:SAM-dependent methyltransferase